jgi:hypothetical protein
MGASSQPWTRAVVSAAGLVLAVTAVAVAAAVLTPLDEPEPELAAGATAVVDDVDDDLGFGALANGHHRAITVQDLTAEEQAALDDQLAVTREVAERYPTVADAEAAGYRRAGPYSPGLGAHYIRASGEALNPDGVMDPADLEQPLAILYDGTEPGSEVVGFMYYSIGGAEPTGFAGPNDVWHQHSSVCIVTRPDGSTDAPLGADREATAEECALFGGTLLQQTQWMVHVWSVPGYELDDEDGGTFGEAHPALRCPDGTYHQRPVEEWPDHPLSSCRT